MTKLNKEKLPPHGKVSIPMTKNTFVISFILYCYVWLSCEILLLKKIKCWFSIYDDKTKHKQKQSDVRTFFVHFRTVYLQDIHYICYYFCGKLLFFRKTWSHPFKKGPLWLKKCIPLYMQALDMILNAHFNEAYLNSCLYGWCCTDTFFLSCTCLYL